MAHICLLETLLITKKEAIVSNCSVISLQVCCETPENVEFIHGNANGGTKLAAFPYSLPADWGDEILLDLAHEQSKKMFAIHDLAVEQGPAETNCQVRGPDE